MAKMMAMYESKEPKKQEKKEAKMTPAAHKKAEMKEGMHMMMGMRGMKPAKKK